MAEAGLQVFNDANVLTIDSTYQNLGLRAKHVLYTQHVKMGMNTYETSEVSVTYPKGYICAVSADAKYWVSMGNITTDHGTSVTQNFWVNEKSYPMGTYVDVGRSAPVGTPVTIYVFGPPLHTGNFGLQVFNAGAELVFSSDSDYMNVVGNWTSPIKNGGVGGKFPYVVRPNQRLAYVFSRHGWQENLTWFKGDPWSYLTLYTNAACSEQGQIEAQSWNWFRYMYQSNFDVPYNINQYEFSLLVLDVTGM